MDHKLTDYSELHGDSIIANATESESGKHGFYFSIKIYSTLEKCTYAR